VRYETTPNSSAAVQKTNKPHTSASVPMQEICVARVTPEIVEISHPRRDVFYFGSVFSVRFFRGLKSRPYFGDLAASKPQARRHARRGELGGGGTPCE
jgi:hypothetical protein